MAGNRCFIRSESAPPTARHPADSGGEPTKPVMILTRRTYTSNDVRIEFARGVHAASRFSWTYDFKLPITATSSRSSR